MRLAVRELAGENGHQAGRQLLGQLYRQETGEALPPVSVTPGGKPYLENSPWHFSVSHTTRHVFCVLARKNVGLDAEELDRPIRQSLAEKILSPGEKAQFDRAEDKEKALLTFWVLKEAEAKRTGEGLRIYPNHTNFSLDDPRVQEIDRCLVAILTDEEETHAV